MVGVGTALSGIHIGSATYIIEQTGGFKSDSQPAGAVITGTALAGAGFMAAAARWDPEPSDSLFMGTSAAWGAFYGSLGQVALDARLSPVARVATGTALMDVGLGVGAVIVSDATSVTPKDTLWPQLFGVAGATVGHSVSCWEPEPNPSPSARSLSDTRHRGRCAVALNFRPHRRPARSTWRTLLPGSWTSWPCRLYRKTATSAQLWD